MAGADRQVGPGMGLTCRGICGVGLASGPLPVHLSM